MTMTLSNKLHFVAALLDELRQAKGDLPNRMLPTIVSSLQEMAEGAEELEAELKDQRAVDVGWLIYRNGLNLDLKNADTTNVAFFPQRARVSADVVRIAP